MSKSELETEFYGMLDKDDLDGAMALLADNLEPVPDKDQAHPFSPALRLRATDGNEEGLVDNAIAMSRAWRNAHYRITLALGYKNLRLLEEGDSWHQYPVLLNDIIDVLMQKRYAVASLAAAGDTAEGIALAGEYVAAIRKYNPDVFLLSMGGNDLLGTGNFSAILKPFKKGLAAKDLILMSQMDQRIKRVIKHYHSVISKSLAVSPNLQICMHGYDYVHPRRNGKWLGKPLAKKGIPLSIGRGITSILLDTFNAALQEMARQYPNNVHYSDLRKSADRGASSWHDEIHPKNPGFQRAGNVVIETLKKIAKAGKSEAFEAVGTQMPSGLSRAEINQKLEAGAAAVQHMLANPAPMPIDQTARAAHKDLEALMAELSQPEDPTRIASRRNYSLRYPSVGFERILGDNNLDDYSVLPRSVKVGDSVARLFIRGPGGENGAATGFLIGGGLLMTNNHVFPTAAHAKDSIASFHYENNADNMMREPVHFTVTPDVFLTSAELDYSIVSLAPTSANGTPLANFGFIKMLPESGKALKQEYVNIIQHPGGNLKHVAIRNNQVIGRKNQYLYYSADTMPGSSGSFVGNEEWQLVAIHHMGIPDPDNPGAFIANRGIRVSAILEDVIQQRNDGNTQAKAVDTILQDVRTLAPALEVTQVGTSLDVERLALLEERLTQLEQAQPLAEDISG